MIGYLLAMTIINVLVLFVAANTFSENPGFLRIVSVSFLGSILPQFIPSLAVPFFFEIVSIIIWTIAIKVLFGSNTLNSVKMGVVTFLVTFALTMTGVYSLLGSFIPL